MEQLAAFRVGAWSQQGLMTRFDDHLEQTITDVVNVFKAVAVGAALTFGYLVPASAATVEPSTSGMKTPKNKHLAGILQRGESIDAKLDRSFEADESKLNPDLLALAKQAIAAIEARKTPR